LTVVFVRFFRGRGVMVAISGTPQAMPRFDSSARFDANLTYDSGPGPAPWTPNIKSKSKLMNKFKLELSRKTVEEKLTMGTQHINSSTTAPATTFYPTANRVPPDATIAAMQADLQQASDEVDSAEVIWKQKIQTRDAKVALWDQSLTARAAYYEAATPDNLEALASVGLPLRAAPTPIGDLPAPQDLRATPRDVEGEVDLRCKSLKGAGSYEWECRVHTDAGVWEQVKVSLGANIRVTGLTPGTIYAFRVRGIGSAGAGAWSGEVVVRAP